MNDFINYPVTWCGSQTGINLSFHFCSSNVADKIFNQSQTARLFNLSDSQCYRQHNLPRDNNTRAKSAAIFIRSRPLQCIIVAAFSALAIIFIPLDLKPKSYVS